MSAQAPWMKFYPADWQADQALRLCSLSARGLWVECMCIMHRAVPYGHLVVNGRPVTDAQLAVLVGALPTQIPDLLGELEVAGAFSRTKQGVIFSRRMTRDDKKARVARQNGKSGGNPTLCKTKGKSPSDNPQDKGGDKAQMPDTRDQKKTKEADASLRRDEPAETGEDLKTRIFGPALDWLAKQSGKEIARLRPLVGKWCSKHGDGRTLDAFNQAFRAAPVDPIAWIEGRLNEENPNGKAAETDTGKREDRAAQLVARLAARSGAGVGPGARTDADPVLPAVSG